MMPHHKPQNNGFKSCQKTEDWQQLTEKPLSDSTRKCARSVCRPTDQSTDAPGQHTIIDLSSDNVPNNKCEVAILQQKQPLM